MRVLNLRLTVAPTVSNRLGFSRYKSAPRASTAMIASQDRAGCITSVLGTMRVKRLALTSLRMHFWRSVAPSDASRDGANVRLRFICAYVRDDDQRRPAWLYAAGIGRLI
jgi:hypothetical protein